ncbi:spermine synthase [Pelagicoccus sp. SDUM812002]|uniref:spermine synthase n=1 Tax=Pelagicoccus sp. SDUM812002 TaxID=3041266 RepID=UPI00280E63AD|nr:spermine synthase [Pelagicoccus sp. SDUM812002]MDQ8185769.1 MnmC family methyltransferase [Pelagicoccus sp. SDUM812002]
MKPNITLAETITPNGGRMTLVEHDGSFCIRVNGQQLMHSMVATSEILLGTLGCERHATEGLEAKVLIGGLGLGFTLKSVLQATPSQARVHVAELFPEIVDWNRTFMKGLNGDALDDMRVEVLIEDVRAVIARAASDPYDVIALDIDNDTTAMVDNKNNKLYEVGGMREIWRAMAPDGRAAIWSACPDAVIERRLKKVGFKVQAVPAKVSASSKREAYMIYVADKPAR